MKPDKIKATQGVTVLKYGDTYIKVKKVEVDEDVNPDRITRIDLNNILAEIVTTPVIMNQWGTMLAELNHDLKVKELEFDIYCANKKEEIREKFTKAGEKFTVDKVNDSIVSEDKYLTSKKEIFELQRQIDITNSIYWAIKDKSAKLENLSLTIHRDDIQNMESTVINGIKIVIRNMN